MHCGTKKEKSINYQVTEWNFVFVWPKSLCSFSLTHPANQTPSPVNSTHHIAQTLPSSCAPGHWPQSGPLPHIRCHGLYLSHIQALLGTTVRAVSPDCRSECSDLRVLLLLDWASEQKLRSVTASWGPDLGAGDGLWVPGINSL